MLKQVALFTFFLCIGSLLVNNGLALLLSESFVNLLRDVGGVSALVLAVITALE